MGVKKSKESTESKQASQTSPFEFFGEVKEEVNRISWTPTEELQVYTKVVVGVTFVMGLGIYFMDLFIQGTLAGFNHLVRFITG